MKYPNLLGALVLVLALALTGNLAAKKADPWKATLNADACKEFATTGSGTYFKLEPGYRQVLTGKEDGEDVKVIITVLAKTKKVGGIEARVVEEKEWANGTLKESTRDYMAVCKDSNTLLYLGEEVDNYKNGKVKSHAGSWMHGAKGTRYGVLIPGQPAVGQKFYQEQAPGVGMDRAEIVSLTETLKTPAGDFTNCMKTLETTPLEPGHQEYKLYAPGIGLVQDGDLLLTEQGLAK
jgi:hypothetical protein